MGGTTALEVLPKGGVSEAQDIVDRVTQWSEENIFQLHPDKCKEIRISFTQKPATLDPLIVNGEEIKTAECAKLY